MKSPKESSFPNLINNRIGYFTMSIFKWSKTHQFGHYYIILNYYKVSIFYVSKLKFPLLSLINLLISEHTQWKKKFVFFLRFWSYLKHFRKLIRVFLRKCSHKSWFWFRIILRFVNSCISPATFEFDILGRISNYFEAISKFFRAYNFSLIELAQCLAQC